MTADKQTSDGPLLALSRHPDAFRVQALIRTYEVEFAQRAGLVMTLEGNVRHEVGDAIVTGLKGERWPVARARFLESYEPVACGVMGRDGRFRKRPRTCWALVLDRFHEVQLSGQRGTLQGKSGDLLIEYAVGDQAIVDPDVFAATYERIED